MSREEKGAEDESPIKRYNRQAMMRLNRNMKRWNKKATQAQDKVTVDTTISRMS